MANKYWIGASGGTGTNYETAANWNPSGVPVDGDNIYFDSTASYDCKISDARQVNNIIIENNFDQLFEFDNSSAALTCDSLLVKAAGKIKASAASKIKFIGTGTAETSPARNTYITFQHADMGTAALGMFDTSTSRGNMTFDFSGVSSSVSVVLENGVYPNLDFSGNSSTYTFRPAAQSTQNMINTYGTTDILEFKTDNNCKVQNIFQRSADLDKIFKISGKIDAACEKFMWGLTTLHIRPQIADDIFPTSGNYHATGSGHKFGAINSSIKYFTAQYHKLVIDSNGTHNFLMDAASTLTCNEFVIKSGGRLYGPDEQATQGSEIHSVVLPTIEGDWNFNQISKGIYRSRTHGPALNYFHGGTGLNTLGTANQVLAVHSDGDRLEWSSTAGGTARTVTVDTSGDGSANETLGGSETLMLKKGSNVTLAESGGVVTISSTDTNTTYSVGDGGLTTNDFTNADHTKLNGIEASADVTDATNVTAAGALMDSEVTNLAFVKGLTSGISNTNVLVANANVADNDFLKIDGTSVEGRTAAEVRSDLNVEDGATADQTATEIIGLLNSDLGGNFTIGNQANDTATFTGPIHTTHLKSDNIEIGNTNEIFVTGGTLFFQYDTGTPVQIGRSAEEAVLRLHGDLKLG